MISGSFGPDMVITKKNDLKKWFLMKFAGVIKPFDEKAFIQLQYTYSKVPEEHKDFFMELLDKHYNLDKGNDKELFEMCKIIGVFQ